MKSTYKIPTVQQTTRNGGKKKKRRSWG